MDKRILCILILVMAASLANAGGIGRNETRAGLMVTAIHHTTYIGGCFELGLGRRVALGGDVNLWLEGNGGMVLSPHLAYYFPLRVSRLELVAGAGPSLAFGFQGGSAFRVKIFGGARYWLSRKTAFFSRLVAEFGDGDDLGGTLGIEWRL